MIPAEQGNLQANVVTHPGMKGKQNEDRYAVSSHTYQLQTPLHSTLAIISDGIGGHRAGEIAAEMSVELISRKIAESNPLRPQAALKEAIIATSQAVREEALKDLSKRGMGATCACAWILGDRLYVASVGDSRVYLIRGERIRQLTVDHTWIQEAVDKGLLTMEEAAGHPNQHVIRRFLGSETPPMPDMRLFFDPHDSDEEAKLRQGMRLEPGDYVILCSDGLTDLVADWEILARVKQLQIEEALNGLVDLANSRGGHDNITVIALQIPKDFARQPRGIQDAPTIPVKLATPMERVSPSNNVIFACLGLAIVLVIGMIIASALGWQPFGSVTPSTPTVTQIATLTQTVITIRVIEPTTTLLPPALQASSTVPVQPQPTYTAWPTATLAASP